MIFVPIIFINSLAALAEISWWTFIWTTIVGFIPLGGIYTFAGRELGTIESMSDILSPSLIAIFVILIILVCLPIIIRYIRSEEPSI